MKIKNLNRQEANTGTSFFSEQKYMEHRSIAACCIVKNEMHRIAKWLENVRAFAGEIVVVDTGSTDGTAEWLESQQDVRLVQEAWQGDFARARNRALAEAAGEWIVFTDADEIFYHPEGLQTWLAQAWGKNPRLEAVFCPIDNVDMAEGREQINQDIVPRIFRNHRGISYTGAVHEQLSKNNIPWQDIEYTIAGRELAIRHTGYDSRGIVDKHQRNLDIMEKAIAEGADARFYYGFISEAMLGLGRYQEALDNALQAMASPYQALVQRNKYVQIALDAMSRLGLRAQEVLGADRVEKLCAQMLAENKWHEYALCQWLDIWLLGREDIGREELLQAVYGAWEELYLADAQEARQLLEVLKVNGYLRLAEYIGRRRGLSDNMGDGMKDIGQQLRNQEYAEIEQTALQAAARSFQLLFVSLLGSQYVSGESWFGRKLALLPEAQQQIVLLYHGKGKNVVLQISDYTAMLTCVFIHGSEEVKQKYLQLTEGMPGSCLCEVGHILVELEEYGWALAVLGRLEAEDEAVTGAFWLDCGKCLYHQQDYANALLALANARELGCEAPELDAYMAWCQEGVKA